MWDSLLLDFLYLTSDAMSGKSIPVLFAVTLFHLDPHLLGTVVLIGACVATVINVVKTLRQTNNKTFEWIMRFIQYSVSILMSMILLARLMNQMTTSGIMIASIPSFWVIIHSLPEKPITLQVLFIITIILFYVSLIISPQMIIDSDYAFKHQRELQSIQTITQIQSQLIHNKRELQSLPIQIQSHLIHNKRELQAMHRKDWVKKTLPQTVQPIEHPIQSVLPQCLYILILTVYACTLHGPLYSFTGKYCSPTLLINRMYAIFICFLSSIFKAYLIITIAWLQQNIIHIILEGNMDMKFAMWLYMIILLLSINWNVTHVVYNLLTSIQDDPETMKIKYTIVLFALAYMYQWNGIYYAITTLCLFQLITMSLTIIYY